MRQGFAFWVWMMYFALGRIMPPTGMYRIPTLKRCLDLCFVIPRWCDGISRYLISLFGFHETRLRSLDLDEVPALGRAMPSTGMYRVQTMVRMRAYLRGNYAPIHHSCNHDSTIQIWIEVAWIYMFADWIMSSLMVCSHSNHPVRKRYLVWWQWCVITLGFFSEFDRDPILEVL